MTGSKRFGLCGIALLTAPALAWGVPFSADLQPLNGSGVSGSANLELEGDSLSVDIDASGLEENQTHPQFIRGLFDNGTPAESSIPDLSNDTDNDGFIEETIAEEGPAAYGEAILPLSSPPGGSNQDFPTADDDGNISFSQEYDLDDEANFIQGFSRDDLLPLDRRTIVMHGLTPDGSPGTGSPGEVDGTPGYKIFLPVAAATIEREQAGPPDPVPVGPPEDVPGEGPPAEIPEPGVLSLLAMGFLAFLSGFGRRFRKVHG